ncbi:hypothetical protein [Modestobacter sp. SYSU DS0875]
MTRATRKVEMSAHTSLPELLRRPPEISNVDATPDFANGLGSAVVRCVFRGQRVVAVDSDTKTRVGALLDLVDLHLQGDDSVGDSAVASDEVTLLVADNRWETEAEGALRTLAAQLDTTFRVDLRWLTTDGEVLPITTSGLDDLGDHRKYHYTRWRELLLRVENRSSPLVQAVLAVVPRDDFRVPRDDFRGYPMLSRKGYWSRRLEGLEVAQIGPRRGAVDVGKHRDGGPGPERATWLTVEPTGRLAVIDDPRSVNRAARAITQFAERWHSNVVKLGDRQNEHALESRILRGVVLISHNGQESLDVLLALAPRRVSWGSQFPTRWGMPTSRAARYLDAIMRNGSTPWALEIKVSGGAGVGQYYRHAVAQAVLYGHFIRQAAYLEPWFERFGLNRVACRTSRRGPRLPAQAGPLAAAAAVGLRRLRRRAHHRARAFRHGRGNRVTAGHSSSQMDPLVSLVLCSTAVAVWTWGSCPHSSIATANRTCGFLG